MNKLCGKCGEQKSLDEFTRHSKSKDGFYYSCKDCKNKDRKSSPSGKYNREKARERLDRFMARNPSYVRDYQRNWARLNPDKVRMKKQRQIACGNTAHHSQTRTARMSGLVNDLTLQDWQDALFYFGHSCAYCGNQCHLQREHVVSLAKGGGYTRRNIIPACKHCNASKQDHDLLIWVRRNKTIQPLTLYRILNWTIGA